MESVGRSARRCVRRTPTGYDNGIFVRMRQRDPGMREEGTGTALRLQCSVACAGHRRNARVPRVAADRTSAGPRRPPCEATLVPGRQATEVCLMMPHARAPDCRDLGVQFRPSVRAADGYRACRWVEDGLLRERNGLAGETGPGLKFWESRSDNASTAVQSASRKCGANIVAPAFAGILYPGDEKCLKSSTPTLPRSMRSAI